MTLIFRVIFLEILPLGVGMNWIPVCSGTLSMCSRSCHCLCHVDDAASVATKSKQGKFRNAAGCRVQWKPWSGLTGVSFECFPSDLLRWSCVSSAPQIFGACSDRNLQVIFVPWRRLWNSLWVPWRWWMPTSHATTCKRPMISSWRTVARATIPWETGPGGSGRCTAGLRVSLSVMVMGGWWSH